MTTSCNFFSPTVMLSSSSAESNSTADAGWTRHPCARGQCFIIKLFAVTAFFALTKEGDECFVRLALGERGLKRVRKNLKIAARKTSLDRFLNE